MNRDEALALADRILALINAQPSTPSREEIADEIQRPALTIAELRKRLAADPTGRGPDHSDTFGGPLTVEHIKRAKNAMVENGIPDTEFKPIYKGEMGLFDITPEMVDALQAQANWREAERVKYAIVTAIREKDIPDAGFDPRCAHCGGAWNDGDGHAHCCPPEFRETVGGMRLMEEFERRYPVRCATCAHSISGDPQIACNGKPYCSVCFPEREAIEKRHYEVMNEYIDAVKAKGAFGK